MADKFIKMEIGLGKELNVNNALSHSQQEAMADKVIKMEIGLGKELNVNNALSHSQQEAMLQLLQENQNAFDWDYIDMKGLDPMLCTHKIYISPIFKLVR